MPQQKFTIASGCFGSDGYGADFPRSYPFHLLEGVTLKTATPHLVTGADPSPVFHGDHYTLNAVRLRNPGLDVVLGRHLPYWQRLGCRVGVSIRADHPWEWRDMAEAAQDAGADYVELNLACPNAPPPHHSTLALVHAVADVASAVDLPVYAKVGADLRFITTLLDQEQPDRLVLGNSMPAWATPEQLPPAGGACGLSGPPLLPLHIGTIHSLRNRGFDAVHVAACGGIASLADAASCRQAGADSCQMGTAALRDPHLPVRHLMD